MSFGIMCLWQQLHVGSDMVDEDILRLLRYIIYSLFKLLKRSFVAYCHTGIARQDWCMCDMNHTSYDAPDL